MQRVLVAGLPGAGKTTLATALEARLGLPRQELDALHHGPGWTRRPTFEEEVDAFSAEQRWVCEDQYQRLVGTLLWERADTAVWLDLDRSVVMRRVVGRSLRRALLRTELYNGNREQWTHLLDRDHPIRWSWSNFATRREHIAALVAAHPLVRIVHLRTPSEVDAWLDTLLG